jgi:upstream activation factor subunit UAF30
VQEESSEEEEEADEEEEEAPPAKQAKRASGARKPAAPAKRASGKRKPAADGAPPKPNGFTKPLRLSEEMAAWVGKPEASRPEITKHLWSYVKERELQDPANRQWIVADATLKKLTGEAKFKGFSFSALIKKHFLG